MRFPMILSFFAKCHRLPLLTPFLPNQRTNGTYGGGRQGRTFIILAGFGGGIDERPIEKNGEKKTPP